MVVRVDVFGSIVNLVVLGNRDGSGVVGTEGASEGHIKVYKDSVTIEVANMQGRERRILIR